VTDRITWREALGVPLFYAMAAVAFTWPLALHPVTRLAAPVGPGDPYLNLWILGWDLQTIGSHPLAVLTGKIFNANIFHPAAGTLAYSDHLILQALALWPLFRATGSPTFCYNALLVGSLFASALAMYAFARSVTGSRGGALVAGLAWGFIPFRFAHLLHVQLQSLFFLPLAFLFLHKVLAGGRRRDAAWLGVFAGLQAACSVYWGMAAALALGVGAVTLAVGVGRWRSLPLLGRLVTAAVVGTLVVAPFAWPYSVLQRREGFARNLYEASQHEATAGSYVRVPPGNFAYGRSGLLRPATEDRSAAGGGRKVEQGPEQELFPGFVLVGLAAVGFFAAWRRDGRPLAASMVAVALAGFVLSLGPDGVRWLYAFLHRWVFGFQAVRAPARFGVLVSFGLAVLAAVGSRDLAASFRRPGAGRATIACLLAAVAFEFWNAPIPTVPAPPTLSPVARWLRDVQGPGAVLYLPLGTDAGNTIAMVDSLGHGRPIVNGYSGQRPGFFLGLVDTLSKWPSADSLWTLRDLGVRFVVCPSSLAACRTAPTLESRAGAGTPTPLVERVRLDGATIYELAWSPEVEAALPRPELPPPPPPGVLPFADREQAIYRVLWLTGGALGVTAGQATITAERIAATPDAPGADLSVALELTTADWVKQFFEARDRFVTLADAALLPRRRDEAIREGRRRVDRVIRFDPDARTMTAGDGPTLPTPTGARDGLAAFLYARTLPLAVGYEAKFPVVEGSRQLVATLRVVGEETVVVQGRRVQAWRVEARFEARTERRPIDATLLIGRDGQRVPLDIRIEAGFGSFRAELVGYSGR
jgi:hypothetical protein